MERRERDASMSLIDVAGTSSAVETARSMIDVTFRMKENDMFGELKSFLIGKLKIVRLFMNESYWGFICKLVLFVQAKQNECVGLEFFY